MAFELAGNVIPCVTNTQHNLAFFILIYLCKKKIIKYINKNSVNEISLTEQLFLSVIFICQIYIINYF